MSLNKNDMWKRRKQRVRKTVSGTEARPRLTVFRSGRHIYAQIINDDSGSTLVSAATTEADLQGGKCNKEFAVKVGKLIAERAKAKSVDAVVFDRNGYRYHGCIKALADSAREVGLRF